MSGAEQADPKQQLWQGDVQGAINSLAIKVTRAEVERDSWRQMAFEQKRWAKVAEAKLDALAALLDSPDGRNAGELHQAMREVIHG